MKLEKARESYYWYTAEASRVARQLAYAGIALIWIFKSGDATDFSLPYELVLAGFLLALSLLLDFFQYVWASAAWGALGRLREKAKRTEFLAPAWINWPTDALFWLKLMSVGIGFLIVAQFILGKVI